ncbi:FMN-binding protein [Nocardioides zeae]|uniref:FMN-binding protein n=1 Tax=Nocardioides imazamoxiresistens TaxID=3231893 RepID=A0ABU3PSU7_9ACTN|nr:FMN-binding protein [Nocardioides zeae]MDT9591966.1 FMN-binding protein [Nocardioides zeae]
MASLSPARRWFAVVATASTLALTTACGVGQSDDADTGSSADDSSQDAGSGGDGGSGTSEGSGTFTAGTYDAEGGYTSPGGEQSVTVEATIAEDGTIEEIEVTPGATDPTSERYQGQFADGIADEVVGQPIDGLDVSVVSGSSLTSGGFNAAIEDIIAEAQA